MSKITPSNARGTRDFGPLESRQRQFIFDTLKKVFQVYGYEPLETPALENLQTLTGKYGDEGERLIFKILNSGDFASGLADEDWTKLTSTQLIPKLSDKALRYDLTIPLARYVSQNRHKITFPFKRYQIQPVWRADRPQKGRYREFYQCDADAMGSDALMYEIEMACMYRQAFKELGFNDILIRINHRKLLQAFAQEAGCADRLGSITVILDKLDKIGPQNVKEEWSALGLNPKSITVLSKLLQDFKGLAPMPLLEKLSPVLSRSQDGRRAAEELKEVFQGVLTYSGSLENMALDPTLARGLDYYTGTIFEVADKSSGLGSLGGGGRYHNLCGIFGVEGLGGVGISFGADRIYDALVLRQGFPRDTATTVKVLIALFSPETKDTCLSWLNKIRVEGISCDQYPEVSKLSKNLQYAQKKEIPYVLLMGPEELHKQEAKIKDMRSGKQWSVGLNQLIQALKLLP